MNKDVMILAGAGQIGMAIARRTGFGKKIILGDKSIKNAENIAGIMISSQSGWRMPQLTAEQDRQLAMTTTEDLLDLDFLQPEHS